MVVAWRDAAGESVTVGDGDRPALRFAFWNVRRDIVIDNVARYARAAGERVACFVVDGDYASILGAAFVAGDAPDLFYAQRAEASLWQAQGYIAPLDGHPALAPTLARMDKRLVAGARHANGDLLGLTYYNGGPFALFVHEAFSRHIHTGQLTSLDALLGLCRRLARDGLCAHPFVPRWHSTQTGLVWSLLCHLAADGVLDFSSPDAGHTLTAVLAFMRDLVEEGLVPPGSLDDGSDGEALSRWLGGRHALTFTTDYLAMDACEQAARPISVVAPRVPGMTGTPLLPGHALLCMGKGQPPERAQRVLRLMAFLGGLDRDATPRVHARWLSECLFAVPFPELDAQPRIRKAMQAAFPPDQAEACVARMIAARQAAVVSPPTHAPWFLDWSGFCDRLVREDVLRSGSLSPDMAAGRLLDKWFALEAADRAG